jgi:probable rRNA maturation factor
MAVVNFFSQGIKFNVKNPRRLSRWIQSATKQEGSTPKEINYIFCSDKYLLSINEQYLGHNTLTDIITFDNSETPRLLESDIFISIERVKENALTLNQPFDIELRRVMIHGVLHLVGYGDKSSSQKSSMRKKEEAYLSLY